MMFWVNKKLSKLCVIFSFSWPSPWSSNPGCSCPTWWPPPPTPTTIPPLALPRVQDQILTAQSLNKQTPTIKWTNKQYWHSCSPYSTLQYSTVTGEEDGVTPHSTLCGVRGLDLLSVTNVKNVTEEEERREGEGTSLGLGFWLEGMGAYGPILLSPAEGLERPFGPPDKWGKFILISNENNSR